MSSEIVSYYGKRPLWQKVIGAALFTGMLLALFNAIFEPPYPGKDNNPGNVISWLLIAYTCFLFGGIFARVRDIHFDFRKKKYKIINRIGPIGIGKWKDFESINYVSVFRRGASHYQVLLWKDKRKGKLVSGFYSYFEAFRFAKQLAHDLQTDLLDAGIDPRNSKWINLSQEFSNE